MIGLLAGCTGTISDVGPAGGVNGGGRSPASVAPKEWAIPGS